MTKEFEISHLTQNWIFSFFVAVKFDGILRYPYVSSKKQLWIMYRVHDVIAKALGEWVFSPVAQTPLLPIKFDTELWTLIQLLPVKTT